MDFKDLNIENINYFFIKELKYYKVIAIKDYHQITPWIAKNKTKTKHAPCVSESPGTEVDRYRKIDTADVLAFSESKMAD